MVLYGEDSGGGPTSFPRGAPTSSSSFKSRDAETAKTSDRKKKKKKNKKEDDDFLFGEQRKIHTSRKRKKSRDADAPDFDMDDDDELYDDDTILVDRTCQLPIGGGAVIQPELKSSSKTKKHKGSSGSTTNSALIESISFAKLAKNMKLLGYIREVTDDYAIVSLPYMLTGFIQRRKSREAPKMTSVVSKDQMLPVTIIRTSSIQTKEGTKNKRIELSVDPIKVNSGLTVDMMKCEGRVVRGKIVSVEDHGCVVDLGLGLSAGVKGFLKFENVEPTYKILQDGEDDDNEEDSEEEDSDEDASDDSNSDDESDDDDKKKKETKTDKKESKQQEEEPPQIYLNKNRVFDFIIHPSNTTSPNTSIIQLTLPSTETLSETQTSFFTTSLSPTSSAITKDAREAEKTIQQQHTLRSLNAGMLVKTTIEHYAKNGLCVSFLSGLFRGSIDLTHLGGFAPSDKLLSSDPNLKQYAKKKKGGTGQEEEWYKHVFGGRLRHVMARIIVMDPVTKIIRLSLLPHILHLEKKVPLEEEKSTEICSAGDVFHNVRVVRLDHGIGALLALPPRQGDDDLEKERKDEEAMEEDSDDDEENIKKKKKVFTNLHINDLYKVASKVKCAYVHISKAMDPPSSTSDDKSSNKKKKNKTPYKTPEALFHKHFATNHTIRSIRILSTNNTMDDIPSAAAAPSLVQANVFTYKDIKPGAIYKDVQVLSHLEGGAILVQLGQNVKGILPLQQLYDKPTSDADDEVTKQYRIQTKIKKYPLSSTINAVRCLTVDATKKKCLLTAKKSLLTNNIDNCITSYSNIPKNSIHYGFVTAVTSKGVVVTFFNNIHGFVSGKSLAEELGVEDPTLNYRVGQVLKTRVVKVKEKKNDFNGRVYHDLTLSLSTSNVTSETKGGEEEEEMVHLEAGTILPPKSMKIVSLVPSKTANSNSTADGDEDEEESYIPGYAIVTIKLKYLQQQQQEADEDKEKTDFEKKSSSAGAKTIECKLPYSQILDHYDPKVIKSSSKLNDFASGMLKVGKKINQQGLIIDSSKIDRVNHKKRMAVISLKPSFIETAVKLEEEKKKQKEEEEETAGKDTKADKKKNKKKRKKDDKEEQKEETILLPSPKTVGLYMGATVQGYVSRKDARYGSFVHFLDSFTGLIPKLKKGLDVGLHDTITCKIVALDTNVEPPKVLLQKCCALDEKELHDKKKKKRRKEKEEETEKEEKTKDESKEEQQIKKEQEESVEKIDMKPGDTIEGDVKILSVNFNSASLELLHPKYQHWNDVKCRIHVTMAKPSSVSPPSSEEELEKEDKKRKKDQKKKKKKDQKKKKHHAHKVDDDHEITKYHPFYNYKVGDILSSKDDKFKCVAVDVKGSHNFVELTNRTTEKAKNTKTIIPPPIFKHHAKDVPSGTTVTAIVTQVVSPVKRQGGVGGEGKCVGGLKVQVCPGLHGFATVLEVTNKMEVLKDLKSYFPIGCVVTCRVLESVGEGNKSSTKQYLDLSMLLPQEDKIFSPSKKYKNKKNKSSVRLQVTKPNAGDLVLGRIDRSHHSISPPSLMIMLRGGYIGRCDITELDDRNDWINRPLGRCNHLGGDSGKKDGKGDKAEGRVVTDEEEEQKEQERKGEKEVNSNQQEQDDDDDEININASQREFGDYPHGQYIQCRVLSSKSSSHKGADHSKVVEVSVRKSRIVNKNLIQDDYDENPPKPGGIVHAFVITTNKKGCFVRLSRSVEGRVILKHLSDSFLPDPVAAFQPGRLVVGRVKEVKKDKKRTMVDLDLRETALLEAKDKLTFKDIKVGSKYKGRITRIEQYGVFVHIDNSEVSGLAHLSECSDNYIKNLSNLYDPGDLVKALVIKTDEENRRVGFSLKASHFEDDSDSDESESTSSSSDEDSEDEVEVVKKTIDLSGDTDDDESIDSDDEDYASKLAAKLQTADKKIRSKGEKQEQTSGSKSSESDQEGSSSESESDDDDSESSDDSDDEDDNKAVQTMDTDVGFDWGGQGSSATKEKKNVGDDSDSSSEEESSDDNDDDDDMDDDKKKSSHKSRKKAAAKRREEQEISLRESALADGTADENPETSADFERLLASDPNNSESWIKYMAFHLSLADIDSARNIANRAFDRIEFRQEREKLNVWTALLTLELKYGSAKSLQTTIDRACQHNNPKQVYLRVCEMLEREVEAAKTGNASSTDQVDSIARADEMFTKMCKKFKSKKTVWIAHLTYLLKNGRHTEAHALLKRALLSLPQYKHIEIMSKFAQLEFEHGSAERARTIFDGLLEKHPKRMDLVFVYVDKEVKNGEIQAARHLFERIVNPPTEADPEGQKKKKTKMSDKQMKALFKKWYRMEEDHGDDESREHVKESARAYVERSTASKS